MTFNEFISAIFITAIFSTIPAGVISGITKIFHNLNEEDRIKIDFKNG